MLWPGFNATYSFIPLHRFGTKTSRILILGSFPSVKSRETNFFYGSPQNRFWRVLAAVLGREKPESTEEKKRFLLSNRIAVWDVIGRCEIAGSADGSIRNALPNDTHPCWQAATFAKFSPTEKPQYVLYVKRIQPETGQRQYVLPSTSPADAACKLRAAGR